MTTIFGLFTNYRLSKKATNRGLLGRLTSGRLLIGVQVDESHASEVVEILRKWVKLVIKNIIQLDKLLLFWTGRAIER